MDKNSLKKIYFNFLRIRRCQEEIINRYHPSDKMKCPMHFCLGQELMPSVLNLFLKKKDSLFSHHRSHGYFLSKGGLMKEMIAEFYGKKTGTNGGLAGSQELSCIKSSFYSGTILSGALAMAVGDSYEKIYNRSNYISVAVVGDGGMEEGIVYESINLAVLMNLPVLFICENNSYSTHTNIDERSKISLLSEKIKGFGIKTSIIKDQKVNQTFKIINETIKRMRIDRKPKFIEIMTYRHNGHVGPEGDDHFNYRSKNERSLWLSKDPIYEIEKKISKFYNLNNLKKSFLKKIDTEINFSFTFAEISAYPSKSQHYNYNNTYSKVINKFEELNIPFNFNQEDHKPKPY